MLVLNFFLLHAHVNTFIMCFTQVPLQTVQPFYTQKEPGRSMLAAHMQFSGGFFLGKLNRSCIFCVLEIFLWDGSSKWNLVWIRLRCNLYVKKFCRISTAISSESLPTLNFMDLGYAKNWLLILSSLWVAENLTIILLSWTVHLQSSGCLAVCSKRWLLRIPSLWRRRIISPSWLCCQ